MREFHDLLEGVQSDALVSTFQNRLAREITYGNAGRALEQRLVHFSDDKNIEFTMNMQRMNIASSWTSSGSITCSYSQPLFMDNAKHTPTLIVRPSRSICRATRKGGYGDPPPPVPRTPQPSAIHSGEHQNLYETITDGNKPRSSSDTVQERSSKI